MYSQVGFHVPVNKLLQLKNVPFLQLQFVYVYM